MLLFLGEEIFIYIFDSEFIEVIYKTENFMHLTGVDSKKLKSQKFYEKTKYGTLKRNQNMHSVFQIILYHLI